MTRDLFDGIGECRLYASIVEKEFGITNMDHEQYNKMMKTRLTRRLCDVLLDSEKIVVEGQSKPIDAFDSPAIEYRAELFIFTRDELLQFISNVRRDEQEQFIPRS